MTGSVTALPGDRLRRRFASANSAPVLDRAAFHGLAGEIVGALEPLTEASPAAMLVTILATVGAMVGREAYVSVGSARHYPAIFAVIVGNSARARKGTSKAAIDPIFAAAGDDVHRFLDARVISGLGSGEGLTAALATGGSPTIGEDRHEPCTDQRLLIFEEEFSRVLISAQRSDSTLSTAIRTAWDGARLQSRTKSRVLVAEQPHLGVLAHVTRPDLDALRPSDLGNGFANRFMFVHSSRTRLLPEPGRLSATVTSALGARLDTALTMAHGVGEMTRTQAFRNVWAPLYMDIESQTAAGTVYDQLTARGAPQILRLAVIYAVLDQSRVLDAQHLTAAAALWDYCEATVAHLWGMGLADAQAERLRRALDDAGPAGMTGDAINALFSRNLSTARIEQLRRTLIGYGLAYLVTRQGRGRPATVLISTRWPPDDDTIKTP